MMTSTIRKIGLLGLSSLSLVLMSQECFAEANSWKLGIRALYLDPQASSPSLSVIGGSINYVSPKYVPEVDANYFFSNYFSSELSVYTSRNNVQARGTTFGSVNLGQVHMLSPTLSLLVHFFPEAVIEPYVGIGVNYTHFYDIDSGSDVGSLTYGDSYGPALQAGLDINIDKHWALNVDVKKVYIKTHVTASVSGVGEVTDTHVKVNPYIYGVGVRYQF